MGFRDWSFRSPIHYEPVFHRIFFTFWVWVVHSCIATFTGDDFAPRWAAGETPKLFSQSASTHVRLSHRSCSFRYSRWMWLIRWGWEWLIPFFCIENNEISPFLSFRWAFCKSCMHSKTFSLWLPWSSNYNKIKNLLNRGIDLFVISLFGYWLEFTDRSLSECKHWNVFVVFIVPSTFLNDFMVLINNVWLVFRFCRLLFIVVTSIRRV